MQIIEGHYNLIFKEKLLQKEIMVEAVAKTGSQPILEPLKSQVIKARADLNKVLKAKHSGTNIYDHIVKVVDRIVQSCPDRAIERFEEISYLVKNSDEIDLEEFVRCHEDRKYAQHCPATAKGTSGQIESLRSMFPIIQPAAAGGDGEAEAPDQGPVTGLVQDLTSLNKHVFNQAGVELGEYGSFILQKSL